MKDKLEKVKKIFPEARIKRWEFLYLDGKIRKYKFSDCILIDDGTNKFVISFRPFKDTYLDFKDYNINILEYNRNMMTISQIDFPIASSKSFSKILKVLEAIKLCEEG